MRHLKSFTAFCKNQKNRLSERSKVTPGTPPATDTIIESRLTGRKTPVRPEVKFTAVSVAAPTSIDNSDLLRGCLLFDM